MNLSFIMRALGIKITPEQCAQIEAIIPQIPAKIQEIVIAVNGSLRNFDERLKIIEATQRVIVEVLCDVRRKLDDSDGDNARPAGRGDNERRFSGEVIRRDDS